MKAMDKFIVGIVAWICFIPAMANSEIRCQENPIRSNYFFGILGGGGSNETFLRSLYCDAAIWEWRKADLKLSEYTSDIYSLNNAEKQSAIDANPDLYDISQENPKWKGISISRGYQYEFVLVGYGGLDLDLLNFTREEGDELIWRETFDNTTDIKESKHSFFLTSLGIQVCLFKIENPFIGLNISIIPSLARIDYQYKDNYGGEGKKDIIDFFFKANAYGSLRIPWTQLRVRVGTSLYEIGQKFFPQLCGSSDCPEKIVLQTTSITLSYRFGGFDNQTGDSTPE